MYIVKNIKAVNSLVRAGFDLISIEKDKFNADKVVFKFEDTEEFREYWTNYCNKYRKVK